MLIELACVLPQRRRVRRVHVFLFREYSCESDTDAAATTQQRFPSAQHSRREGSYIRRARLDAVLNELSVQIVVAVVRGYDIGMLATISENNAALQN